MNNNLAKILQAGGVAVIPTDTIYGLVGQALSQKTVERIYEIKKRRPEKPFIVLISNLGQLAEFGVDLTQDQNKILSQLWPGPYSVILKANKNLNYLKRGGETLAFRMPAKEGLAKLIEKTGPLVAPSANPEGLESAKNLAEARGYFGNKVDFYVEGTTNDRSSTLLDLTGAPRVLRGDEAILQSLK